MFGSSIPYETTPGISPKNVEVIAGTKTEEELIQYELEPTGLSFDTLLNEKPEGDYYAEKEYSVPDGLFKTPTGKIEIYSEALELVGANPLPVYIDPHRSPVSADPKFLKRYPLILSTGHRNYYSCHSQFRSIDALRANNPEPFAEMGPETCEKYGLSDGDIAIIKTNRGEITMKVALDERIAEGCVFIPHGWEGEQNAHLLTDTNNREEILGYPDMKSLLCAVVKA